MREGSNISKYNDLAYSDNKGLFLNLTLYVNLWCFLLKFIPFSSKLIISVYFCYCVRETTLHKEVRCPQSALDAMVLLAVCYGVAACNPTTVGRNIRGLEL